MAVPEVYLAPGDALIEVEFATVCGSDLHTVHGRRSAPTPLVLGHEQVGKVVAVGEGARRAGGQALAIGDRVIWSIMVSCGDCDRCLKGVPQKCRRLAKYGHEQVRHGWELSGGFATHVHLRSGTTIVPVAQSMPREIAAPLSCASATAIAAIDAAASVMNLDGATMLVTGAGLVGLTVAAAATDRGARVIVSDPDPSRRANALRFGAIETVDPMSPAGLPDSFEAVQTRLGLQDGLDISIEASGSSAAVAQAIDCLDIGGVAVLVGSVHPAGRVQLDPEAVVRGLKTVRGVHNYAPKHLIDAVAYLEERHCAYPFAELVGTSYPLSELDEAIAEATTGGHVRVGIIP
ncbi:alcohol dehydrogenase [Arthrobacter glacialis]|nr:alcohol dehydrogenase [Arthrobacter glacialis]